jgi:hypothetical protein
MSIELCLVDSIVTGDKRIRKLLKQLMEDHDDRFNKLRL